ncbi:hypothetical protein UFOVP610_27 [uncultured Caudovirales phage]|uniref:Uncharacterized protein n=1 Tax=uncultured Caudovirales phage TaxID=2100421 RepID=A0A6J5N0Z9_9CAUD|nr:hypothetical protein UFOVP610_27 [uncultured Caudovirales phage]
MMQIVEFRQYNSVSGKLVLPFPKRKIPVQFRVGSPSKTYLSLDSFLILLNWLSSYFTKSLGQNWGKSLFGKISSPLIQLTISLSQSIKKSKFNGLVMEVFSGSY